MGFPSDGRIAEALDNSIANVERTRRQLAEEGFAAVLTRKYNPKSARPRIFDDAAEAKLIALACGPAPTGYARWTLSLLEEKVVELNIVEKASDNTIGRTLKKTFSSLHIARTKVGGTRRKSFDCRWLRAPATTSTCSAKFFPKAAPTRAAFSFCDPPDVAA
ncbi:helix-turn-helix domain-containing protein [Rhodoblastus sp.]|uniref:helix-turn-helix domain-containing protein n=1 Tax=Rhodoblastus sp. TaxID=1962975 RepID=UPI003F9A0951